MTDERTSPAIASIAARGLLRPDSLTPAEVQRVCASALTQAPDAAVKALVEQVEGGG